MKKYFLDDVARVVLIIAFLPLILSFLIVYSVVMKTRELEGIEEEKYKNMTYSHTLKGRVS